MKKRSELVSYLSERARTQSDINEHLLFLYKMVLKANAQKIVELGTRGGNSTCALVIGAAQTGGHVVSVDHGKGAEYAGEPPTWDSIAQTSALITSKLGLGDFWTLVVKDDLDFAREYNEEVDLLFIDTSHSYEQTKRELEAWGTKVVNGGTILIHDTVSFPEQNKAIWEFLDRYPSSDFVEHRNCNGLGIITKNTTALSKTKIRRSKQEPTPGLWRDRVNRLQESLIDMRNRLREKDNDLIARLNQEKVKLESELSGRFKDPLGKLLWVYSNRPDLEQAFPEAREGDYQRLIEWANDVIRKHKDEHNSLSTFAGWYSKNVITSEPELKVSREMLENERSSLRAQVSKFEKELSIRTDENRSLQNELSSKTEQVSRLKSELSHESSEVGSLRRELSLKSEEAGSLKKQVENRSDEINRLEDELSLKSSEIGSLRRELAARSDEDAKLKEQLSEKSTETTQLRRDLGLTESRLKSASSDIDTLRAKLTKAQGELEELKRSFGYAFMRFYASRIDRFSPEGSRRGELRKIAVQSVRIADEEGIGSLVRQIGEKLRKHEFKIIEPALQLEPAIKFKEPKPTVELAAQVFGSCDHPPLSPDTVARVAGSFMVSGWALAQEGIERIDVYLDDAHLGPAIYGIARPDIMKAFPAYHGADKAGFTKFVSVDADGKRHKLRILATTKAESSLTLEGEIAVQETFLVEAQLSAAPLKPTGPTSSIIILTKTPPPDFEQTLQGIRRQEGVADPEIIIINSGQSNLSDLSEKYHAKVLNISPQEFDHSRTRNLGAEKATGDYVIYMTDDAIPASNQLLSSMIKFLESDKNVAAATARQIPRSDSDLMSCQAAWGHYKMLNLTEDRVVGTDHFNDLTPADKRQLCQIDDVCSCYRRDQLLRYKFATRVRYAEDLELGIRFVRDGYKIAQLYSTGVIHSHIRPATYFLKRTYADVKTISGLLQYADWNAYDRRTLPALVNSVICLYGALSSAIDALRKHAFYGGDSPMVFSTIEASMKLPQTTMGLKSSETELSNFLEQIASVVEVKSTDEPGENVFGSRYLASIRTFEEWLLQTRGNVTGLENDFIEALYKLLGALVGTIFAEYYLWTRTIGLTDERFEKLDGVLSSDI